MIKVKIGHASNNQVNFLEITGHAHSAEYPRDLVCAAASAIVVGGFNNLKNHQNYKLKVDEGHAIFQSEGPLDAHDEVVIETIICGLKTLQETDPKFIEIKTDK